VSKIDDDFEEHAEGMAPGQRALEAVVFYRANGQPVPAWALDEIESAYTDFKDGARDAGWTPTTRTRIGEAPKSLGEAFGIPDEISPWREAKRYRAMLGFRIWWMFNNPFNPRSKSDPNYQAVAEQFNLTKDKVSRMALRKRERD